MLPPLAIGAQELGIIALVIVVLFVGVKKLPELGKGLAEGITEFRKAMRGKKEEDTKTEDIQDDKPE
jgi:sec-independent protein translocase protein TatA